MSFIYFFSSFFFSLLKEHILCFVFSQLSPDNMHFFKGLFESLSSPNGFEFSYLSLSIIDSKLLYTSLHSSLIKIQVFDVSFSLSNPSQSSSYDLSLKSLNDLYSLHFLLTSLHAVSSHDLVFFRFLMRFFFYKINYIIYFCCLFHCFVFFFKSIFYNINYIILKF